VRYRYIGDSSCIVTNLATLDDHAIRIEINETSVCVLSGIERATVYRHVRYGCIAAMTTEAGRGIRRNIHVIRRVAKIEPGVDGRRQHEILVHRKETVAFMAVPAVGNFARKLDSAIIVQAATETIDSDISIVYSMDHLLEVDSLFLQAIG